jgi:caffeoyl-CoA O-methyltransferase
MRNLIDEKIENYCIDHSMSITGVLEEIERYTHLKVQMPHMLSGKYQGQILSFLSKLVKPKNILELGTFTGYSGICLYQGIQENGMMVTIDKNGEIEEDVKMFFEKAGVLRGTNYIIGNAMEIVPTLKEYFDLVFIDADKKNYIHYLDMIAPK